MINNYTELKITQTKNGGIYEKDEKEWHIITTYNDYANKQHDSCQCCGD